jgi:hypothetical protein
MDPGTGCDLCLFRERLWSIGKIGSGSCRWSDKCAHAPAFGSENCPDKISIGETRRSARGKGVGFLFHRAGSNIAVECPANPVAR